MSSTQVARLIDAARPAIYRALLDPDAVARWRVPAGMTSVVHDFDPREGGFFRVTLTYDAADARGKTQGRSDTYHGRFARLVPDEQVVEEIEFESDDPALRAPMTMTWTLRDSAGGTVVAVRHDGLPDAIPAADNELGTRMSLDNLARLVEQAHGKPAAARP